MWELDHKGSWAPKNWCFWTVVLKKTLESPLDWKEIKPVFPKGNSSGIFIGSTDSEGETLIFGHLMWRSDSLEKTLMLGNSESKSRRGWQSPTQSPTQWTWAWLSPRSWWCTGMPGMLQSMGSQKVGHHWVTDLQKKKKMNCVSSGFSDPVSFNLATISERYVSFSTISLWVLWAESKGWSSHW